VAFKVNKVVIALCAVLFLISLLIILRVYNVEGLNWDFVDLYLNAKTFLNPSFYQQHLPVNLTEIAFFNGNYYPITPRYLITTSHVYFSIVREPLVSVILALLIALFSTYSVQVYLALLMLFLLLSSFFVSKELNINPLILASLLFAPYVIRWTVLYTSQEVLSLCLALIAVGLISKKSSWTGAVIALVGLTKYPGLILLPLLFLLLDHQDMKKSGMKVAKAFGLFAIVTLPWLLFNYIYFGNPLISYQASFGEAVSNGTSAGSLSLLGAIASVPSLMLYPLIILLVGIALLIKFGRIKLDMPGIRSAILGLSYRYKIVLCYTILSIIGFIALYSNVGTPERFAYLLYGGFAMLAALAIESAGIYLKDWIDMVPYAICSISILLLLLLYISVIPSNYSTWFGNTTTNNVDVKEAAAYINKTYGQCPVVSNAWPLLNYYGVVAYESDDYCTVQQHNYPAVLFKFVGPALYCGNGLNPGGFPPGDTYLIIKNNTSPAC